MLLACLLAISCSRRGDSALPKSPVVTASFYPLQVMLLNICEGTDVRVERLAPSDTGCLHDYQLTTKDMRKIESSDVVVLNGMGMEDFLDKAVSLKGGHVVVASEGFISADGNPHVWVSVSGAIYQVGRISEALCEMDPRNAQTFAENAERYIARLEDLRSRMHDELDGFRGSRIITFHEAFPYFASEFALEVASVVEREPGTAPSPKELNDAIGKIRKENEDSGRTIPLFAEPQYSSASAQIIARETGSTVYELDPCVTPSGGEIGKDDYIAAMEKNLSVLKEALSK